MRSRQARVIEALYASAADFHDERTDMKTSLGIWALGGMVTRFVPGGYQPEHGRLESRPRRCSVPWPGSRAWSTTTSSTTRGELSQDNLDEVQEALDGHGIYCIASGLHVDHRFGKGGLTSVDPGVRETAREISARRRTSPASWARTSSSGPGSRATTTRSRRPTARAGGG